MKKLLFDFNNLIYASFFANLKSNIESIDRNRNFVKHLFFNKLLHLKQYFSCSFNDIYICIDGKNNWRKKVFEHYKFKRKENREKSDIDYSILFRVVDELSKELKIFPFYTLKMDFLEADDWISFMCEQFENEKEVVIISTDKDFYQLQKCSNVIQYHHIKNTIIKITEPKKELFVKILKGDSGDGIPNILSDGDTFYVEKKRQKPLRQKKIDEILNEKNLKKYLIEENLLNNFKRNKMLIDLSIRPKSLIEKQIKYIKEYNQFINKSTLESYFMGYKMNIMKSRINEFFS